MKPAAQQRAAAPAVDAALKRRLDDVLCKRRISQAGDAGVRAQIR
jgi:hypothetical protein